MTESEMLKSNAPATMGFLAGCLRMVGVETGKRLSPLAVRLKEVESRNAQLVVRLDRQAQQISSLSKEVAALARKQT